MLVPITKTIWREKVGTRDSGACNAIDPNEYAYSQYLLYIECSSPARSTCPVPETGLAGPHVLKPDIICLFARTGPFLASLKSGQSSADRSGDSIQRVAIITAPLTPLPASSYILSMKPATASRRWTVRPCRPLVDKIGRAFID